LNIWNELGIAPSRDAREIKLAYAAKLKQVNPEDDPEGFQRLRTAYERATALATRAAKLDASKVAQADPETSTVSAFQSPASIVVSAPPIPTQSSTPTPRPSSSLADTAAALCQHWIRTPLGQRRAALAHSLASLESEQLDYQLSLQQALARQVLAQVGHYLPLVPLLDERYGWSESQRRLGGDPVVAELLERYAARQWRLQFESARDENARRRLDALELLANEPRIASFKFFARRSKNLGVMRQLLQALLSPKLGYLRYEVNRSSVQWWLQYFNSYPRAWDQRAWIVISGVLLGPMILFAIAEFVDSIVGSHWHEQGGIPPPLVFCSFFLPLGLDALVRWLRRTARQPKWQALWERARHNAKQRRIATLATGLCLIGSAATVIHPIFAVFAIAASLLLAFWTSVHFAVLSVVLWSWPLHGALMALLLGLYAQVPLLARFSDPPTGWFAHVAAAFLVAPFTRLCRRCYRFFRKEDPKEPYKFAFYTACALLIGGVVIGLCIVSAHEPTTIHLVRHPIPKVQKSVAATQPLPPAQLGSATAPQSLAASKIPAITETPPVPVSVDTALRSQKQLQAVLDGDKATFSALLQNYSLSHPRGEAKKITITMTVAPSGTVTASHVTSSNFADAELEAKMLAATRRLRFEPLANGRAQLVLGSWSLRTMTVPKIPILADFPEKPVSPSYPSAQVWNPSAQYAKGDLVRYKGQIWKADMEASGDAPDFSVAWHSVP
jgi:hypothetical protein